MQKIILIIIALVTVTISLSAAIITKELNGYRCGDNAELYYLDGVKGIYHDSEVYDFSRCKTGDIYLQKISRYNDSLLSVYENRNVNIYDLRGDSLVLLSHRQLGLNLRYILPEIQMEYPFCSGDEIIGNFYAEGIDGASGYLRHCGNYSLKANEIGKIVTPDGDTIPDVLMTTYIRHGATVVETDFSNSFYRTQDSSMLSIDTINHNIITDSITHRVIHQCWYASGYRYPIVEIRHYLTYYYGIQNDSVTIALYHSPTSQKYNLPSDPENEAIRLDGYSSSGISPRTKGASLTKSSTRSKTYQPAVEYQDYIGSESMDVCTDLMTQNSCEVYPTDVENSTIIRLNLYETMQIKAILYNSSGKVMWKNDNSYSPGTYSIDCDMGSLADGNYLMNVAIGKNSYNYKLVKR